MTFREHNVHYFLDVLKFIFWQMLFSVMCLKTVRRYVVNILKLC